VTRETPDWKVVIITVAVSGCSGIGRPDCQMKPTNVAFNSLDAGTSPDKPAASTTTAVVFCGETWSLDSRSIACHEPFLSNLQPIERLQKLKELDLSGTRVSDLQSVATLPALEALRVDSTLVANLKPLYGLKNLRALDLGSTKTSMIEIEKLKDALPDLWIVVPGEK